jgi:hypothetical protein
MKSTSGFSHEPINLVMHEFVTPKYRPTSAPAYPNSRTAILAQNMEVIGHQYPGIDIQRFLCAKPPQPIKEIVSICIVCKNVFSFNAPAHYMM